MKRAPDRLWPGREDIDRARLEDKDELRHTLAIAALVAFVLVAIAWLLFS